MLRSKIANLRGLRTIRNSGVSARYLYSSHHEGSNIGSEHNSLRQQSEPDNPSQFLNQGHFISTPSSMHVPQMPMEWDIDSAEDPHFATRFTYSPNDKLLENSVADYENDYFIPRVQKPVFRKEPFEEVHSASPLGHIMVVADISGTKVHANVAPLFAENNAKFHFKFVCGGYAYHTSKNPVRQTLTNSLPQRLFKGKAASQPLTLSDGIQKVIMKRKVNGGFPLNEVPIGSFEKLEFGNLTSMACGEDSVVASTQLLGLADGVSGWNHHTGGHAALWSRLILHRTISHFVENYNIHHLHPELAKEKVHERNEPPRPASKSMPLTQDNQTQSRLDVIDALDDAFVETKDTLEKQQETGSSTLIIAALNEEQNTLDILNIGDSSIWVFREGEVIFTVNHVAKQANCPRQLGTNTTELPSTLVSPFSIPVEPGDLILMSSDGVSDNLWINEIEDILREKYDKDRDESLQEVADSIVHLATDRSFDNFAVCPYQLNAATSANAGGKTDDISVLFAKVIEREQID